MMYTRQQFIQFSCTIHQNTINFLKTYKSDENVINFINKEINKDVFNKTENSWRIKESPPISFFKEKTHVVSMLNKLTLENNVNNNNLKKEIISKINNEEIKEEVIKEIFEKSSIILFEIINNDNTKSQTFNFKCKSLQFCFEKELFNNKNTNIIKNYFNILDSKIIELLFLYESFEIKESFLKKLTIELNIKEEELKDYTENNNELVKNEIHCIYEKNKSIILPKLLFIFLIKKNNFIQNKDFINFTKKYRNLLKNNILEYDKDKKNDILLYQIYYLAFVFNEIEKACKFFNIKIKTSSALMKYTPWFKY